MILFVISANPNYACVKFRDGREDTVSTRDLAPLPQVNNAIPDSGLLEESSLPAELESVFTHSTATSEAPIYGAVEIISGEVKAVPTD